MEYSKVFKDAFLYPTKNWKIFILLGVLAIIINLFWQVNLNILSTGYVTIGVLLVTIAIMIIYIFIQGYNLDIIRETIHHSDELPAIDFTKNLLDGVRVFIISIVYFIPLIVIWFYSAYLFGFFKMLNTIRPFVVKHGYNYFNYIPEDWLINFMGTFLTLLIIGIVLLFITLSFFYIAEARLAKFDKLLSAFQIREILNDISKIKWGNYILWLFILFIILFLLYLVYLIIFSIGIIGIIISSLLICPYVFIFISRNIGLIYKEIEN